MEDIGLKIKISADVRNALLNIVNLTDATSELAVEGVGNITAINQALKDLRDSQRGTGDTKELAAVNRAIKDLSSESARLRKVGVEGFNEFGEKAKEASGNVLGFANGAFGALRKLAYILPGVGVAGLIGAISSSIIDFFKDSSKEAKEAAKVNKEYFATFQKQAPLNLEEAKAAIKEYQKIVTDTVSATGKETAEVDILVSRLHEGNLTRQQTVEVIKKLQSIAPDYFSKLNAERATVDDVTAAYDKYNRALVSSIEAQIHIAEITDLVKDRLNFAKQAPAAAKFVNDLLAQGKSLDEISKVVTDNFRQQNTAAIRIGQANKANNEALQKQLALTDKIPFGVSSIIDYLRREQDLLKQIGDAPLKEIGVDDKTKKNLGDVAEILKRVADITAELAKPDKRPVFMRRLEGGLDLPDGEQSPLVQAIEAQIEETKKKLAAAASDPALVDAYGKLVNVLTRKLDKVLHPALSPSIDFTLANPADAEKAFNKIESAVLKEFGKPIEFKIPVKIKAEFESFDRHGVGINLQNAIQAALQDVAKNQGDISIYPKNIRIRIEKNAISEQLDKQLGEVLDRKRIEETLASSGLSEFGQSIGEAIAQGRNPIVAAGKSILTSLGTLIEDIGKNLIEYGIAKQFLDTVLASGITLPGVVAIGLGVAAEAIGALVKNAGQSYHAFATGGIVTGPTLGLVGEAGPEVIFPLNQLNRFIQGTRGASSTDVNVRGVVSGNNLRLVLARANKNQGLV